MTLKQKLLSYKNNFILAFIVTGMILFPDMLANYHWKHYADYDLFLFVLEILSIYIFLLLFTMTKKIYFIISSFFLVSIGFVEIVYYAFFRTYMKDYDWGLIVETEDIIGSLKSIISLVMLVLFLMVIFLIILYLLEKYIKPRKNRYAKYILLLSSGIFFIGAIYNSHKFPNKKYFSLINTSSTLVLAIAHAFSFHKEKKFLPYSVIKANSQKPIVIMIMGESLNAKKMNLFGFNYLNTPMLNQLKTDINFQYKSAVSGGVDTVISVPTFFYVKREPQNRILANSNKTNLMRLAKQNGYKTYWLSTQHEEREIEEVFQYADVVKTRRDWAKPLYDDVLVKYLKNINFNQKTFVVLHLRANHSPYEDFTPRAYYKWKFNYNDYHKYKLFSYMNSVLYVDNLIYSIIDYMKNNEKNFVIYFTSDHGEMLGTKEEHWVYGHSQLDINCAIVPFLYYSDRYKKNLNQAIYSHYSISKMLAHDLGFTVANPNEDGSYFVNGVDTFGKWGFIHYRLPINVKKQETNTTLEIL